jgi:hypothetical protein
MLVEVRSSDGYGPKMLMTSRVCTPSKRGGCVQKLWLLNFLVHASIAKRPFDRRSSCDYVCLLIMMFGLDTPDPYAIRFR